MGGPIVRVGSTPEFAEAWDKIFGGKSGDGKAGKPKAKGKAKPAAKKKAGKKKAKK
jgi:hypothetical protein